MSSYLPPEWEEKTMSEMRQNLATKEWVIIASERARRPEEFLEAGRELAECRPAWEKGCPFCPDASGGEEHETLRIPEEGDWQIRILRNKYPALIDVGESKREFDGVHRSMAGIGYHEIVVESPLHNLSPALQTPEEIQRILQAYLIRGKEISKDMRIEEILFFKNHGNRAGTSLLHPHSQLIALPVVPYRTRQRAEEARRYSDDTGECVFCRMLKDEIKSQQRIISINKHFVAFILYAAFSPFHMWVLPRRHVSSFLDISSQEQVDLSLLMREVLRKLYIGLRDPDYNYAIRSAPLHDPGKDYLHWYITIIPRVTRSAGFEMGSGMFINTALPEDSAAWLRGVSLGG
jgi:UDPglucose--hexose-1-phosphate uridylyltransferase